jgi:hypothetical protein
MQSEIVPVIAGACVALAFIGMAGYVVVSLGKTAPKYLVGALIALAGLFGALPPVLFALTRW